MSWARPRVACQRYKVSRHVTMPQDDFSSMLGPLPESSSIHYWRTSQLHLLLDRRQPVQEIAGSVAEV